MKRERKKRCPAYEEVSGGSNRLHRLTKLTWPGRPNEKRG